MKKPKILIAMHYLELGGAESALLGLLLAHDPARADIDLFLYDRRGKLVEDIPPTIHLLPVLSPYNFLERPIKETLNNGLYRFAFRRLLSKIPYFIDQIHNRPRKDSIAIHHYVANSVLPCLPPINPATTYDLAISFLTPHQYVLKKVKARQRIAWLHTDYSKVYVSDDEAPVWQQYSYIAAISEGVGQAFAQRFPALKDKIIPLENILCADFIRKRAQEDDYQYPTMGVNILSVGRYTYAKRFDKLPMICRLLIQALGEQGKDLHWYIVGYGGLDEEKKITDAITDEGMQTHITLLGKQENPYPYIRACDLYVQPSRYEGKSITVREAQILQKPVFISHYETAPSQVNDGLDGVILPMEETAFATALAEWIQHPARLKALTNYLASHHYGNEHEIEKIYQIAQDAAAGA